MTALLVFAGAQGAKAVPPLPLKKPVLQAEGQAGVVAVPLRKPVAGSAKAVAVAPVAEGEYQSATFMHRIFDQFTSGKRLSEEDAARYAHIFAFQDMGDFTRADAEIRKLQSRRLIGYVLRQRYLHPDYTAQYAELAAWMKSFADHPGAQNIYELALRKKPKEAAVPAAPKPAGRGVYGQHDFDVGPLAQPYMREQKLSSRQKDLLRRLRGRLGDSPTAALKMLEGSGGLFSPIERAALRGEIAESYFYNGKVEKAYALARESSDSAAAELPMSGWIAGLAAWKTGKYGEAARYFERAATSERSSAWLASAGAHWAARAWLRARQPQKVNGWLRRAAEHPRTFYGIISMKALGMDRGNFNWDTPELTDRSVRALASVPAGRRAVALVDAEQPELAALELRQINPGKDDVLREAMIALAQQVRVPSFSLQLGSSFVSSKGELYDAALYPDAPWAPEGGYDVDKALVYAFIRQESRFEPGVKNKASGATGLMQLMPATARHVAQITGRDISGESLLDPEVNISLGQKYLAELLENNLVDNNLFRLAVAYNAGPGKLARWEKNVSYDDDPLLFIESIPAGETRMFVERVLANFWIYRMKYDQDTVSLDKVAEGEWPVYVAQDIRRGLRFADAATFFSR